MIPQLPSLLKMFPLLLKILPRKANLSLILPLDFLLLDHSPHSLHCSPIFLPGVPVPLHWLPAVIILLLPG